MKEKITKKQLSVILGAVVVVLVAVIVILILHQRGAFEPEEPKATVTEVSLSDVDDKSIIDKIEADKVTPGYYIYDSDKGSYVLLTFGETLNLVMNVNPEISGMSVYFKVGFTKIAEEEPHIESHLYFTDATAIGGDEGYLVFPGYGVGATGYNVGWSEVTSDGRRYIIPLEETRILDRIATADPGVDMTFGFYRYEYEVTSTGVEIHSAAPLDTYAIWCSVRNIDEENNSCELLVGKENVVLTAYFDPGAIGTVKQMESASQTMKVIMENRDNVPFMKLNTATTPTESTEEVLADD